MGDTEDRVTELELRFMQQENIIQELNETVCRQELLIGRLERDVALISEQLRVSVVSSLADPDADERPPHY